MKTHDFTFQEKRSFSRYPVRDNSGAILMTPGNIVSYCILDVSKSGLAFCYNGRFGEDKKRKNAIVTFLAEDVGSIDIFVQIVSDSKLDEEDLWRPSQEDRLNIPYLRRCGVKFNLLSPGQEDTIDMYIESLTTN